MKKTDIARAKRKRQTLQGPKEKDRHCKGQKKKYKKNNNGGQNTTQRHTNLRT
jgi:hypothetical protein